MPSFTGIKRWGCTMIKAIFDACFLYSALLRGLLLRLSAAGGGPNGLIVSSSNTIHRGVQSENYRAMLETIRYAVTESSEVVV